MPEEGTDFITEVEKYNILDTRRKILLGTFDTEEAAGQFLINNPTYRKPEIKIIPTLTYKDMMSLAHLIGCLSDIYDTNKKTWFDNKIANKIAEEFVEKIDDIRSSESVEDYI